MCRPLPKGRKFFGVIARLEKELTKKRLLRQKEGKKRPIFINLYSRNSVEKGWVEKKTVGAGLGKYVR
jgi:hypothetical protein